VGVLESVRIVVVVVALVAAPMVVGAPWWRFWAAAALFGVAVGAGADLSGWKGEVVNLLEIGMMSFIGALWWNRRVEAGRGEIRPRLWPARRMRGGEPSEGATTERRDQPEQPAARRVWRVRWWLRLLSLTVPLAVLPLEYRSIALDPAWRTRSVYEWLLTALLDAALILAVWAAFRSRIELADGQVCIVNPWKTHTFPASDVVAVRPGGLGAEFLLHRPGPARPVTAFAVACTAVYVGAEPRWVDVAKAVTGEEPTW
jgi:hypothetical protein